jgi:hypothetical protein
MLWWTYNLVGSVGGWDTSVNPAKSLSGSAFGDLNVVARVGEHHADTLAHKLCTVKTELTEWCVPQTVTLHCRGNTAVRATALHSIFGVGDASLSAV